MEIDINQKKISVGDKYRIFIDGQQTYAASARLFKLLSVIDLFELNTTVPLTTINKRFSWFKAKYDITRPDNSVLPFRTESFWGLHYRCPCGNDIYDIYGHRGRRYSIYKNDTQIAWWQKKAVTWFGGDNYKMIADRDSDVELIVSFCLILDNFLSKDSEGRAVTINLGNIGFRKKKFDAGWLPKDRLY